MYRKTISQLFQEVSSSTDGLSVHQAHKRLQENGRNVLQECKKESKIMIFLRQYKDFLVILLIISALVSLLVGEISSSIVILVVITLNAGIGTYQEIKAIKSLDSLKKLTKNLVKVKRDNQLFEIDCEELVVGDVVLLQAGDIVSADGRIIKADSLMINESSLTGESVSVEKTAADIEASDLTLGDQKNMAFSSGLVTNGKGEMLVLKTGMNSELGKIACLLNSAKERQTPLQENLDKFAKSLSIVICCICALVFGITVLQGNKILDAIMFAIALAVAAIPEALSSIVTIILSISTEKMVKENAIVKEINKIETLGCVNVICSDKTGTLTQNKMTVTDVYVGDIQSKATEIKVDSNVEFINKIAVLCNDSHINNEQRIGDPTELALLDFSNNIGIDENALKHQHFRKQEIPFDSDRKLMSIVTEISGQNYLFVKGAFDVLVSRCHLVFDNFQENELTNDIIENFNKQNHFYTNGGKRVLAFAYKKVDENFSLKLEEEDNLVLVGLYAMIDPLRIESKQAVENSIKAGIKPVMITGDHILTATAIAKELGIVLENDICIEGKELDKMSDAELKEKVEHISVYARVTPSHKIRIVDAFQSLGKVVAMTGDGVNDAPALKKSDIGIAMGITGTNVSKDASSMILTDDNFKTIVKAIAIGRNVFQNIKNAIIYLLGGNFAGILVVLFSAICGLPLPFTAIQLLFINLITDSLPALAIGMEKEKDDVLNKKPRNVNEQILNIKTSTQVLTEGLVIAVFVVASYLYGLNIGTGYAMTFAFLSLCIARLLHGFNCRSEQSIFKIGLFSNFFSILAFLFGYLLIGLIVLVPAVGAIFDVSILSVNNFLMINLFALIPTVIIQIIKLFKK